MLKKCSPKMIALLLAVTVLTLGAAPALAWQDMGSPDFQPARPDVVTKKVIGHASMVTKSDTIRWGTPEYPWSLAKAE